MEQKKPKIVHKDPVYFIIIRILFLLVQLAISILFFLYVIEFAYSGSSFLIPNTLNLPHF